MLLTSSNINLLAILSLAFLWIFTGLTSVLFAPEIGYQILARAGIDGLFSEVCVYLGALLDLSLGGWLLASPWMRLQWIKLCCMVQAGTIIIYSGLLSIIDDSFWLHPFGPLTKNIPILVLILVVFNYSKGKESRE